MKAFKLLMTGILSILSICAFAQDTTMKKAKMHTMKMDQIKYSCPMHPEVTSNKPGKCPKCGMDLVKSKTGKMKMDMPKSFCCPMHPDVTSTKPGKCSKCGMDLKKIDNSKMTKSYACPMHPEVTSDKAGKCSKCGMDLKSIKEDEHADHQH
ncbi:MAG: heavy metal-binding domain-containing protein [Ferruginibacter sp.]